MSARIPPFRLSDGFGRGLFQSLLKSAESLAIRRRRHAGFGTTEVHELEHDIQNYYYVNRI